MSYKNDVDPCSKFKSVDKLLSKLRELIVVCRENLYRSHKLQKQAYNKNDKLRNYVSGNKVLLNNKYIKTKQKQKLEAKIFELFCVLHFVGKQAYKIEIPKK